MWNGFIKWSTNIFRELKGLDDLDENYQCSVESLPESKTVIAAKTKIWFGGRFMYSSKYCTVTLSHKYLAHFATSHSIS